MLIFHELAPSPNNTKLRMALRFKGIAFDAVPVDPAERQPVLDLSGQELTPVVQDKGIVLNDSEAIIQFLDANYPQTPRLYPRTRAGRRECDKWKATIDERLSAYWVAPFFYAIKRRDDLDGDSLKRFADGLAWVNEQIGDRDSFHDDPEMAICDLRVAQWATYALPSEGLIERVGLFKVFREVYSADASALGNLVRFLAPWNERLS